MPYWDSCILDIDWKLLTDKIGDDDGCYKMAEIPDRHIETVEGVDWDVGYVCHMCVQFTTMNWHLSSIV